MIRKSTSLLIAPLSVKSVKGGTEHVTQFIQDYKIEIANFTIDRAQRDEMWPQGEEYNSFVTSETRNNLFREPERFDRIMHAKPEWYARKFIYRPKVDASKKMFEAITLALELAAFKLEKYIQAPNVSGKPNVSTGYSASSFHILRNGERVNNRRQLDNITKEDTLSLINTAVYATTSEVNAVYHAKVGGIIYYAAKTIQKAYPDLNVKFNYRKSEFVKGTLGNLNVPALTIGTGDTIVDKIVKPGKKIRSKKRRDARTKKLQAKAAARTAAGARGEYG